MNVPVLKTTNLQGGYGGIPVLHGVNITAFVGEIVGVLGHNGMGKTTLLKTIMGLQPTTGGTIYLGNKNVTDLPTATRALMGLAYVPQGRGIFSNLTVSENIRFAASMGEDEEEIDGVIEKVLQDLPNLRPLLSRRGGSLSGGEQQQLALARALVANPVLLLLDEPTEGIQPSIVEKILELLKTINLRDGCTIVLVEQKLKVISALCARVYIMKRGKIAAEIVGEEIRATGRLESLLEFTAKSVPTHAAKSVPAHAAKKNDLTVPARSFTDSPLHRSSVSRSLSVDKADHKEKLHVTIKRPSLEQMRTIIEGFGMRMSDPELLEYMEVMEGTMQAYDLVDSLPENLPTVKYPRTPGRRPSPDENPLNAWYVKCSVKGASDGPLEGKKIVLKDTICLAGVPMMNGASTMEGYMPDVDATLVRRILDAGGEIIGKAHCEYFCLSGGSHTNATGPVHNPYRLGYSAGGSSSGCGALVGAGEVEMAIGGDQGGSIRIPSAWSGCYGMKGTHGLVPYSGVFPIEFTIDTVGPITQTVKDNALLLEVIAGADGLDPRQYAPQTAQYTSALGTGAHGLRIGVVNEGFSHPSSEEAVSAKVQQAAEKFKQLGAEVVNVSIPEHTQGAAIWTPIALEGLVDFMMEGNSAGTNHRGMFITSLLDTHANWRQRADELSPTLKISMFIGKYFRQYYRGRYYGKAQNLARHLRSAYDMQWQKLDLLLMPTLPMKSTPLPPADAPLSLYIQRAFEMIPNTAAFNCTGHPAMNVPCGLVEGLPVGLMLVGRYFDESTIYRAAHALEQSGDWRDF